MSSYGDFIRIFRTGASPLFSPGPNPLRRRRRPPHIPLSFPSSLTSPMADGGDDADEAAAELTDKQKKEIAKWFLTNAPAGEINYVAKGPLSLSFPPQLLRYFLLLWSLYRCRTMQIYVRFSATIVSTRRRRPRRSRFTTRAIWSRSRCPIGAAMWVRNAMIACSFLKFDDVVCWII